MILRSDDIHVADKNGLDGVYWTRHSAHCYTSGVSCPEGKGVKIVNNEVVITDESGHDWKVIIIAFNGELKSVMKDDVCYNDIAEVMGQSSHWRTDWNVLKMLEHFSSDGVISVNLDPKFFGLIPAGKKLEEYPAYEDEDGWYHDWGLVAV